MNDLLKPKINRRDILSLQPITSDLRHCESHHLTKVSPQIDVLLLTLKLTLSLPEAVDLVEVSDPRSADRGTTILEWVRHYRLGKVIVFTESMWKFWQALRTRRPGFLSPDTTNTQIRGKTTRHSTSEYDDNSPLLHNVAMAPLKGDKTASIVGKHISDQLEYSKKVNRKQTRRAATESVLTEREIQYRQRTLEESKVRAWSIAF